MAPPPKRCPGCLKTFSSQRAHLSQTLSPLCRQLAKRRKSSRLHFFYVPTPQRNLLNSNPNPPSPVLSSPSIISLDMSPSPEQEDNQSPNQGISQTPGSDGTHSEWDDDESDDEGVDPESSLPGWEPPAPNNTDNTSVSSDNMDADASSPSIPLEDLHDRTWVTPQVVKFPGSHAGKPVRSADSTNNIYATLLGEGSSSNPYSPFASRIDWEAAKWAKLRGPSSTSFAELLDIKGVPILHPSC
jgi:hypothetical protein